MKVSIYKEKPGKKELEFELKLFQFSDRVVLALADRNGEKIRSSSLISITENMELRRGANIDGHLGLPLVSLSRLKMVGEDD